MKTCSGTWLPTCTKTRPAIDGPGAFCLACPLLSTKAAAAGLHEPTVCPLEKDQGFPPGASRASTFPTMIVWSPPS